MNKILLLVCFATISATCFAQKKLAKETFEIIKLNYNGKKLNVATNKTEIRFDYKGKAINGNAGCNNFFGKLTITEPEKKKGKIKINAIGSTKMFCDNMEVEDATFKLLKEVDNFKRKGDKFILRKGRKVLMELRRK